jgi:hypothetical protein
VRLRGVCSKSQKSRSDILARPFKLQKYWPEKSCFPILPRLFFFFFFFEEMICFYLNEHRSGGVKLNWTTIYTPNSCSSS